MITYIRKKEFRYYAEQRPLLIALCFLVMGVPLIVHGVIAGTKDYISEKRKQKEHQEES